MCFNFTERCIYANIIRILTSVLRPHCYRCCCCWWLGDKLIAFVFDSVNQCNVLSVRGVCTKTGEKIAGCCMLFGSNAAEEAALSSPLRFPSTTSAALRRGKAPQRLRLLGSTPSSVSGFKGISHFSWACIRAALCGKYCCVSVCCFTTKIPKLEAPEAALAAGFPNPLLGWKTTYWEISCSADVWCVNKWLALLICCLGGVHSQEVMSRSGDRTSTFDPTHSDTLLHGLNLLWRKQLFCDVTLTAQGQQFHCHKAVLASCSQYFRSLFSSHNVISNEGSKGDQGSSGTPSSSPDDKLVTTSARPINNLVLQGCSSVGLRLVLEYLYTANVTLSLDTVEEVLSVSKILNIPQITKLSVQFLNDQISVQNYKQICKIAALHGLDETKKLANKYLVEDVLLLNFEEMCAMLDALPPPVESELALFQMSVLWLEHDRETRMHYAPDLMKRLRFALIPAPELVERVQSVDFMRSDPVCQKLLLDAMNYHLMPFRQHCRQTMASRWG